MFYQNGKQEVACVGYADVAKKRPITLDDPYMQCSQTKGFCGVTIAILVEEGKISLDDPVSKYLPEFGTLWVKTSEKDGVRTLTKAKNTLTVRMVMNHTGGFPFELPNFHAMGGWSRRMPLRSVAATAASQPINFEPGTKVQYSNVGIDIGATVVEVVTGKRWEDFLKERVFDPLGMTSSGFWPTADQLARQIEMYNCQKGAPAQWRSDNPSMQRPYGDDRVFSSAGAGLWTTARDQLKFYKMLMNLGVGENGARILKEETVKAILATSTRPADLKDPNYSGQRERVVRPRRRVGHELHGQLAQEAAQALGGAALRRSASVGRRAREGGERILQDDARHVGREGLHGPPEVRSLHAQSDPSPAARLRLLGGPIW